MSEQNKELFKEFIEFCESQPEEDQIDHSRWGNCAVGQFASSLGITDLGGKFQDELLGEYAESELHRRLDYIPGLPETYGGFTQFLKRYL